MVPQRLFMGTGQHCRCLVLLQLVLSCCGFNIDLQFPVVKTGNPGSFFGFSVALHNQTKGEQRYLLLSGAPLDQALPSQNANQTGAVYYCPLTDKSDDCKRVDIDEKVDTKKYILDHMWLGVTVTSGGPDGRILACGHRYVAIVLSGQEEQWRMIGRCYPRDNDMKLNISDDWQTDPLELCNPNADHNDQGMCNLGMAAGFIPSGMYFGAPGSYNWQGNTIVQTRVDFSHDNSEFGKLSKENSSSYTGFAVETGYNILQKDKLTIVAGAPRYVHKGAVFLGSLINAPSLQVQQILIGQQVGSFFGSSIALADLNNDGWQDLIVGAPFYFDWKKEIGGAVYIYMNEAGTFQEQPSVTLNGAAWSSFGFAVASIGDVNQDGFQDLAIGAPYDGSGKVFIYHSNEKGLNSEPRQIIDGQEVGQNGIQVFGYSIKGGMDVDENAYPDFLVGSLSDKIALFRARPVIIVSKTFTVTPNIVDAKKCSMEKSCIKADLCFSYILSNGDASYKRNITLSFTVEADKERSKPRVYFVDSKPVPSNVYQGTFSMPSMNCMSLFLNVVDNVRDMLQPINITMSYGLLDRKKRRASGVQSLDNFPVLSGDQKHHVSQEINFQRECGQDNKCESNLQISFQYVDEKLKPLHRKDEVQVLEYRQDVKKLALNLNITNFPSGDKKGEDAHQSSLNITFPPTLLYSAFRSDNQDIACTVSETLICELGNPFKQNQKALLTVIFEATRITLNTSEIDVFLQLSTISLQDDLQPVQAKLLIEYTIQTSLRVSPERPTTYFSGVVMGESGMHTVGDIGSPVNYTFTVTLDGEPLGSVGTLMLLFEWPHEIANGKWLLYITEILMDGTSDKKCVPPGLVVNELNLTLSGRSETRQKREVEHMQNDSPGLVLAASKKGPREVELNCQDGTANCRNFTCPLHNMTREAKVTVHARLWNSTFIEEYKDNNRVKVKAAVYLILQTDKSAIKMEMKQAIAQLIVDSEMIEEKPKEIALWIIIVAAVAGVLLLSLIILLLWKCGFFRRASTRAMYEAKHQKAEMKIQPSETERLTDDL
ncbi:integrin alpha-3 isoform X2 [Protopterus annectens]|uniref:integrin alpha-3 isoform X2 n=1 Tax=Protopterus annectens TaxID=7888 RepID=UPI001CFB94B6|nr:integrin alpha-3 isoform X2 [Protopterus annectens]